MSAETLNRIQPLLAELSAEEKLDLIRVLVNDLKTSVPTSSSSLQGRWQGKMPATLDLDEQLNEMRGEWQKELESIEKIEAGEDDGVA